MLDIKAQVDQAVGSEHDDDMDRLLQKEKAATAAMSLLTNSDFLKSMMDQAALDEKNTENAREAEIRMMANPNIGWLNRNIHAILSVGTVFFILAVLAALLFWPGAVAPDKKDIVLMVIGSLLSVVTLVLSYYFGSSSSSAEKNHLIKAATRT